jgi:hypothetical protein
MGIMEIKKVINNFTDQILNNPTRIVGMTKLDKGWKVTVEVLEDSEYTRQFAQNEVIGIYTIKLDDNLEIISYERERFRERGTA